MRWVPRRVRADVNVSPVHPLREALVLVAGVAGAGVLLAFIVGLFADLLAPRIPTSWEIRLFPDFLLLTEGKAEGQDRRQETLEALLARLASHWPDNPYDLRIGALEAAAPNAIALPGGRILVTSALLETVESENELAFVLGHEMGHFRGRDHLRRLGRGLTLGLLRVALPGNGSGADLFGLAASLTNRSFSRGQEEEADAFGLALVAAEYGTVASAWDFFERLPAPGSRLERDLAGYLSTHPLGEERMMRLSRLASERGWEMEGEPRPLPEGLR